MVYLEIETLDGLIAFMAEAKKTGLLKDISLEGMKRSFSRKDFPIRVPVNLDAVLDLCRNPIIRKAFGKKIEDTTKKYILTAIETGN